MQHLQNKGTLAFAFCAMLALVQPLMATNLTPVYPTVPVSDTNWAVGSKQTIKWNNSGNSTSYNKVDLVLGTGSGNAVTVMGTIASGLAWPATNSYTWTIPSSVGGKQITTGKIYTVQFTTYGGSDPSLNSWSTWFTLTANGSSSGSNDNSNDDDDTSSAGNSTSTSSGKVFKSSASSFTLSIFALAPLAAIMAYMF